MKEKCPNCKTPDPAIKPCADGSCGVCGGSGVIEWKEVGRIESDSNPHRTITRIEVLD